MQQVEFPSNAMIAYKGRIVELKNLERRLNIAINKSIFYSKRVNRMKKLLTKVKKPY